jgi:hypothetical protein
VRVRVPPSAQNAVSVIRNGVFGFVMTLLKFGTAITLFFHIFGNNPQIASFQYLFRFIKPGIQ